jgi:hypothetical protein
VCISIAVNEHSLVENDPKLQRKGALNRAIQHRLHSGSKDRQENLIRVSVEIRRKCIHRARIIAKNGHRNHLLIDEYCIPMTLQTNYYLRQANDAILLRLYIEVHDKGYDVKIPDEIETIALRIAALVLTGRPSYFDKKPPPIPVLHDHGVKTIDTRNIFILRDYIQVREFNAEE